MNDDRSQVGFMVEQDAHERAKDKLAWGELSNRLQETVHQIAYGTETTERRRLKEKLEDLRQERREIDREIDDLKNSRDDVERKIGRVEDRLDTLLDAEGEYDGYLQSIETRLHEGIRFSPSSGQIEDAADVGNTTPKEVIADLKERNPDVPDKAFRDARSHEEPRWKDDTNLKSTQQDTQH